LGEGTAEIIYGESSVPAGPTSYGGYLSRPDGAGEWPTILIFGPEANPTGAIKNICRVFARHGIGALAPDLGENDEERARIAEATATFVMNPAGDWSSAGQGFGIVAFQDGLGVAAWLASEVNHVVAFASVGAAITGQAADDLAKAKVPAIYIGSREDEGSNVDGSLTNRDSLPQTAFVVYPDGGTGFWSDDSAGFVEVRYKDTIDRVIGFLGMHLPERV
jgi:dienelactone hydrolase